MEAFEPLINLLMLMSVLSVAAERLANAIKLRDPWLATKRATRQEEKERERLVARQALLVSILLAAAVRADFFEILAHLDAPWSTLGWAGAGAARNAISAGQILQEAVGLIVTGVALGFGSRFWHEVLDAVRSARRSVPREPAT